jgi:hypothetical protein
MRKVAFAAMMLAGMSLGCVLPIYSSNHNIRARQLIFHSEDLRHVPEIWERTWAMEMPDVATPYRVHGGVI